MLLVGVGASGPKTLIGLMVRDSVPVQHMGLAGGVLGFVGQIGGALAGRGIGSMLEVFGWRSFFPSLLGVAAVCSSVIVIFMWNLRVNKDRINKSE
jgi:sugar phosphate permease